MGWEELKKQTNKMQKYLVYLLVSVMLFLKTGFSQEFIFMCFISYILIELSISDFKYKAVPDYLLLLVLVFSFFATSYSIYESFQNAFLFAGAFVLLNFVVTFYIQNIKSRITKNESLKEQVALGEGDIPIIAMIGVILGIEQGIVALVLAALLTVIPLIYSNIVKKDCELPFIPFLSLGFIIEYLFNITTNNLL